MEPTRPRMSARPRVGAVMRESSLSNVLLPAPLAPMSPTSSPWPISIETSFTAQKGSSGCPEIPPEEAPGEPRGGRKSRYQRFTQILPRSGLTDPVQLANRLGTDYELTHGCLNHIGGGGF